MNIPRNEYPRPQLVRNEYINLNGEWEFEIDNAVCGIEKKYYERRSLDGRITVPFCPESKLSGVENRDFMNCVWYRRDIDIPGEWNGKRVLLHFGAVDYHARVYVNGRFVTEHLGGYTPFCADITDFLSDSGNYITLCAEDKTRSHNQPCGKQSAKLESYGCFYTRTTGIWQTVFMEAVDSAHLLQINFTPDTEKSRIFAQINVSPEAVGCKISMKTSFNGKDTGSAETVAGTSSVMLCAELSELHLWDIGQGNLYDAVIEISKNGKTFDTVGSYFGMRSVSLSEKAFLLNGRKVFGRWVLDQGFYPDGIYTAPTDDDLKNDIINSMKLGFNGARLHEKIFEPRFLYHADKLGYLVWGEHGNWGLDVTTAEGLIHFLPEWIESLERDYSHPSIIGWCPFNETWDFNGRKQCDEVVKTVYEVTKAYDKTRPCIDTSGNFHVKTDIFDVHDYEQDPEKFRENYKDTSKGIINDAIARNPALKHRQHYGGEPIFVSEYGGIKKAVGNDSGWGYGNAPKDDEEFIERYRKLTDVLLDNPDILGFCYTQLYDVEQEVNGLMTYDRRFKFDPKIFYDINTRKAAIED